MRKGGREGERERWRKRGREGGSEEEREAERGREERREAHRPRVQQCHPPRVIPNRQMAVRSPLERLDAASVAASVAATLVDAVDLRVRREDNHLVSACAGGVVHGEPVSAGRPLDGLGVDGGDMGGVEEGGGGGVVDGEEVVGGWAGEEREMACRGAEGERAVEGGEGLWGGDCGCGGEW